MPELPEVETVVRSLRPLLVGRRIIGLELPSLGRNGRGASLYRRLVRQPLHDFQRGVCGAVVKQIGRRGKHILIALETTDRRPSASTLMVHLGMTGRLQFEHSPEPLRPHTHLILNLGAPNLWLHFSDPRRFGQLAWIPGDKFQLAKLGPEPLDVSCNEFIRNLRSRRAMLKSLLLDQRFLSGLGNIYADESLARAGLHPVAIGSCLTNRQAAALHDAIREVLTEAIRLGGSSISDYADAEGRQGWFQQAHQVYGREGEPCFRCGARIRRIVIASRSTHFCPRCQRRGRPRSAEVPSRGKRNR